LVSKRKYHDTTGQITLLDQKEKPPSNFWEEGFSPKKTKRLIKLKRGLFKPLKSFTFPGTKRKYRQGPGGTAIHEWGGPVTGFQANRGGVDTPKVDSSKTGMGSIGPSGVGDGKDQSIYRGRKEKCGVVRRGQSTDEKGKRRIV